jgi:hypothetical protein
LARPGGGGGAPGAGRGGGAPGNLWKTAGKLINGYVSKMDYDTIDELFSVNSNSVSSTDKVIGTNSSDRKRKESTEVSGNYFYDVFPYNTDA